MNIPSIPTDNLYKFISVFGLIIFSIGIYLDDSNRLKSMEYKTALNSLKGKKVVDSLRYYIGGEAISNKISILETEIKNDSVNANRANLVNGQLNAMRNDLALKDELLTKTETRLEELALQESFQNQKYLRNKIYAIWLIILGTSLVVFGFYMWHKKHQKYIDAQVKWKGEIFLELLNDAEEKNRILKEIIENNSTNKSTNQLEESDS